MEIQSEPGPCIGCNLEVEPNMFCYGCEVFICDACTTNDISGFNHKPNDHLLLSDCCNAGVLEGYCNDCNGRAFE